MSQLALFASTAQRRDPVVDCSEEHTWMPLLYSYAPMIKKILQRASSPVPYRKIRHLVSARFGEDRWWGALSTLLDWMVDRGELVETRRYFGPGQTGGYHPAYSLPAQEAA